MDEILSKVDVLEPAPAVTAVEQFAAQCAHDFNNLLTGVLGNLELMQNRARRGGVTEFDTYLDGARSAAQRAADFARRLLLFSGRMAQQPCPVPVNAMAQELAMLMREQAPVVQTELAEDAGDAFCDPGQLELALLELLANAREATLHAGGVTLCTSADAGRVSITVTDSGPGMPPEVAARCIEPFFSMQSSGAGKGMGLAIANHVARHAGGTMSIQSQPGAGTAVTLTLPRHRPASA